MSRLDWLLPRAGPRSLVDPLGTGEVRPRDGPDMGPTFDEILSGRLPGGAVNFSPEAKAQLQGQGIDLGPIDLDRLSRTIDRVADEGGRNCLLLDEKVAYVVNVDERMVTRAGNRHEVRDDVFTEIDSAVLLD